MDEVTKAGLIYSLIPKIMEAVGAVGKSRRNQAQNYSFRGIDDCYNAAQEALYKNGVFNTPKLLSSEHETVPSRSGGSLVYTRVVVEYKFFAQDGSHIVCVTPGEAMDSGDKSTNKAMAAAHKYALIQLLCIPTEGDNDTETHSPEIGKQAIQSPSSGRPRTGHNTPSKAPDRNAGAGAVVPASAPASIPSSPSTNNKISQAQVKRFYTLAGIAGMDEETINARILSPLGITSAADIPPRKYQEICNGLQRAQTQ